MLFFRLEEMLETSEVMMGNDPMAKNMQQMLKGVQKLEMYDILTMLQFKTKLTDLFINWQPVSNFLSQIGLDDQTINSLGTANLNIPGVRNTQWEILTQFLSNFQIVYRSESDYSE